MDEDMKQKRKQCGGLKMTNLDVMKQKIQQMDIDEAGEWFALNCNKCPPTIDCCPDELAIEDVDDEVWQCTMCWKKWFERKIENDD